MTSKLTIAALMLAAVGVTGQAQAATPLSITQGFTAAQTTVTQVQSRTGAGTASFPGTTSAATSTLIPLSKFDAATGILMGARVNVNIPYTVSLVVTGPGSGSRTVDATSSVSASVSFGGGLLNTPVFALAEGCNGGDCANASSNNTITQTGTLSGSVAATAGNLATFLNSDPGSMSLSTVVNAANTSITATGAGLTTARATTTVVAGNLVAGNNNYSLVYDYLKFSSPSFTSGSVTTSQPLDFGTVSNRGGPVNLNFSLFNLGDINTAGVELYQINGPGNAMFSTSASPFLNLAAGQSNVFSMTLNPLNLGFANGVYTFLMRDHAPGGAGIRQYELTLNLIANVFDPVPEPASWLTMMLGFGLTGAIARRRKGSVAA